MNEVGYREIKLTGGLVALVDEEDYSRISMLRWGVSLGRGTPYAARRRPKHLSGPPRMLMHREILKAPPGIEVDHINGNTLDNRKANLRLATRSEQNRNRRKHRGAASRFKGVWLDTRKNRWRAEICFNRKKTKLGYFRNEEDAARAYDAKAKELFGQFARLNFPD